MCFFSKISGMEVLKKTGEILKKSGYFGILSLIFFTALIFLWGRFGDPVIDCGREAYIPYAMADLGKVLFKDIVCIYGPVPYYLNAFIVKLFGPSLNTMQAIGALLSYIFVLGYFCLSKRFIGAPFAFGLTVLIIFSCILTPSISNFIFPYSYAIVCALVFAVFHLIFLFKFVDCTASDTGENALKSGGKTSLYLSFSAFFLSLCLLSKFDFLPCVLPFLIILFLFRKSLKLRDCALSFLAFLIPFGAVFLIFLIQKVSIEDLTFNFKMISNMAYSPSLQYFYTVCTGYFFEFKKTFMFVPKFLVSSFFVILAGVLGYFADKKIGNKALYAGFFILSFVILGAFYLSFGLFRYIFLYLPLLVFLFFIASVAKFILKKAKDPSLSVFMAGIKIYTLILFSIFFSLKTLFGLFHELYGVYYLPFIALSFVIIIFILCPERFKTFAEAAFPWSAGFIIFLFILSNSIAFFGVKSVPVKTPAGTIYTTSPYLNNVISFLKSDMKENDSVLVLPEGLFVNFALHKEHNFFNTSFTPLDFDAYSEDYLINKVSANAPKYLVIIKRDYSDYGKSFICEDFGQKFCAKINELYKNKNLINDEFASVSGHKPVIAVFKRKGM